MASGFAQAQPANDDIGGATVIPGGAPPYADMVDTREATTSAPLFTCNFNGDGNDVWYEWTPENSATYSIDTAGSVAITGAEMDTVLAVYTGAPGMLTEINCTDSGFADAAVLELDAGTTYYIKIGEFAGGVGGGDLVVTIGFPPPPEQIILTSTANVTTPAIRDVLDGDGDGDGDSDEESADRAVAMAGRVMEIPNQERIDHSGGDAVSTGSHVRGENMMRYGGRGHKGDPYSARIKQVFDGQENDDNANVLGILIAPPDTIGDVGKKHYVQMVNLTTEVFDKEGNSLAGPFASSTFWTGLGGPCENENLGDPIIIYDEQKHRWFVSQFQGFGAFAGFQLCVAISNSSDPLGTYNAYQFDFGDIGFPDYPKYGFASKAVNVMVRNFAPPSFAFRGAGLGAIDKRAMLRGLPATMVYYQLPSFEAGFITGDNDGPYFKHVKPTFFTNNSGPSGDRIDVWEIHPNFRKPEKSTLEEVARIDVSPWDSDLCVAFREACVPQPGSGTEDIAFLATIPDRLMHRGQIRNWGYGEQYAILNHTVDGDGMGRAGIRGYLLKKDHHYGWRLVKEGTYIPEDNNHRWMGSMAMTAKGDFCLGYSISGENTYTSIGVVGVNRHKGSIDTLKEVVAYDGNPDMAVQRQTVRWGDYSSMNIDPVDDSCWYTQEHAKPNSFIGEIFGWGTKIIQFRPPGKKKHHGYK